MTVLRPNINNQKVGSSPIPGNLYPFSKIVGTICLWNCYCLVTNSCLTLCSPTDYSPPGSFVHEISQARILKWVAIFFSRGSSQLRDWTSNLLQWQKDSLPLSHQGSPAYEITQPIKANHPIFQAALAFCNEPHPVCGMYVSQNISTSYTITLTFVEFLLHWAIKNLSFIKSSKKVKVLVTQLCPTLCDPMDCSPPGSSVYEIFQARILERVLQGIFLTQGLNPGRLHCRHILYHLSHQGT